ncbi:efflux transporter outer membrane subunit [Pseudomonas typographi]|uniref:Efflux transporter outer membrane subunit n=1 Tax=Pseudomonas typographi TaxID=2715964 RepID=A0ABR7YYK5_9PSED|nr:efflux transporter outer membrane subunit [Pseudomonas typographi]MBD1587765.1 efflux transporter outer membrane subunit [Pseudomonas typographi]MBD1598288.1 efflux transporter outer membrane subunit [Pseudomonas typographi]
MSRRIPRELKALAFWAVSLSLGGCIGTGGIVAHSAAPKAEALATDDAIDHARREAGWPADQWWQAYADRQLNAWVAKAVNGSPTLAMAAARVRLAQAAAGLAEASEAPQIDARGTLARHNWPADQFYGPGELSGQTTWDNQAGLGLGYDLDLWGRERNASEQAVDTAHQRVAEARQAELELAANVVTVYIQLALAYDLREVARETLAQQQQILDIAQTRLRHGIGTQLEVSQAQTPLPETHRQVDALDERIALAGNQLAALAGQGPGAAAGLQRPTLHLAADLPLPAVLPAQLLGQRPDVVAARWGVAAQARGIDVAHAGFYPNVNLVGSLSYMATGGGMLEFLTGQKLSYTAGPAFTLPLFDGGHLRGQLGEATAGYDWAVAHYQQTLVQALKGVSDQLLRRESMEKQAAFAAEGVASAQKTYDLATTAYQRGLTDYLEVLNAQTLLLHQRQVQQQVHAERLQVYAGLVTALGGGLGAGADNPAEPRLQAPATPKALARLDRLLPAHTVP